MSFGAKRDGGSRRSAQHCQTDARNLADSHLTAPEKCAFLTSRAPFSHVGEAFQVVALSWGDYPKFRQRRPCTRSRKRPAPEAIELSSIACQAVAAEPVPNQGTIHQRLNRPRRISGH